MSLTRRGFLTSILALGAAPAIVRADSLMRVVPVETTVLASGDITLARINQIKREILAHAVPLEEVLFQGGMYGMEPSGDWKLLMPIGSPVRIRLEPPVNDYPRPHE